MHDYILNMPLLQTLPDHTSIQMSRFSKDSPLWQQCQQAIACGVFG
jgi:hypothetical protein